MMIDEDGIDKSHELPFLCRRVFVLDCSSCGIEMITLEVVGLN